MVVSSARMKESHIQRDIRAKLGELRLPFFRYQVGTFIAPDGAIVKVGVEGVSDLIGIIPYTIRPEDVGRTIGVFAALEVKKPKGAVRKAQGPFLHMVNRIGGIAAVVRSPEDAAAVAVEMWNCELVKKYTDK